ncbi:MAG: 6-carboxytetrahydropterin synthase, partial [Sedimentisphaerales bacterium]|nr:6-carboxytetrahydropterin synthase [Sedimentisphaerales bacterium]
RIVREQVIERFDHKNLNEDTHEFAERMPTVENMAQVFWERLAGRFSNAQLVRVRLWETSKTYAEYYGPEYSSLQKGEIVI